MALRKDEGSGLPDPERLLDLAARLVLSGRMPMLKRLARLFPCSEHYARLARGELLARRRWPYRVKGIDPASRPDPDEVAAARERLGLPLDEGPVVFGETTPAAESCRQYRREWREGVNFLEKYRWTPDEEEP